MLLDDRSCYGATMNALQVCELLMQRLLNSVCAMLWPAANLLGLGLQLWTFFYEWFMLCYGFTQICIVMNVYG